MASGYWSPISIATATGPTQTQVTAASILPVTSKFTFPPNGIVLGTVIRMRMAGKISCVVTTPGTARFDVRLGSTVIFDTGAIPLCVTAKTNVPFVFDAEITCQLGGAAGNFLGFATLMSEAVLGGLASASGGSPMYLSAVSGGADSAPAVGNNVDLTVANTMDVFFTQTVTTGSITPLTFVAETGALALT